MIESLARHHTLQSPLRLGTQNLPPNRPRFFCELEMGFCGGDPVGFLWLALA